VIWKPSGSNLQAIAIDGSYLVIALFSAIVITLFFARLCNPNEFYPLVSQNEHVYIDFVKYYAGGKMFLAGESANLYDENSGWKWTNKVISPAVMHDPKLLDYPPHWLLVIIPLAYLPIVQAYTIFCIVSAVIGLSAVLLLRRAIGYEQTPFEMLFLIALLWGSAASLSCTMLGQAGWLSLAVVSIFFVTFIKKADTACGITLALSTIKPQFLMLLAIPVLAKKRWKVIAVATVVEILLLTVTGFLLGFKTVLFYPLKLLHDSSDRIAVASAQQMICWRGLVSNFLAPPFSLPIILLMALLGSGIILFLWLKAKTKKQQIGAAALSCIVFLIFSPHVYFYDALTMAVPLALTAPRISLSEAIFKGPIALKFWLVLLLLFPTLFWIPYLMHPVIAYRCLTLYLVVLLLTGLQAGLMDEEATSPLHTA